MTKPQRSLIFFTLTLAFFIVAPAIVLLSQGYLFDFKNLRLVQAGGVFIKTNPESVIINIQPQTGGKSKTLQSKTSLLGSGGTLIKNLLPQKYIVSVKPTTQEEISWEKELEVNPLQVTKATRIIFPVLKPEIASSTILAMPSLIIIPENNRKMFLYTNATGKIFRHENATSTLLVDTKTITGFPRNESISKIIPSSSGKSFLALSKTDGVVFSETQGTFLASSFFKLFLQTEKNNLSQTRFVWHENNDNILFALTSKNNYFFDLEKQEYAVFYNKKIIALSEEYFVDEQGIIYHFDYSNENSIRELLNTGLETQNASIKNLGKNNFLLKNNENEIYFFDETKKEKIADGVEKIIVSEDNSRLAYFNKDDSVFIYFLEDVFDDLLYKKGEALSLGVSNNINNIYFAHFNWQIVTISEKNAMIVEIDKRMPVNKYKINLGKISNTINFEDQTLIWLEDNVLKSAKILP
ncbi:MAG: hypothetical protein A2391_01605 [Candidatus Brennerbacteria bacterium RIFOXYB1_FULL_41_13]|nr:MAG: hypothetical protein A2391_01605 [Candidatus Brennerbacteria bacterium RIFOXYB1_FULL_41_13]